MKLRQAKKILLSRHWDRKFRELRPMYFDEKIGHWCQPSYHDIPIPTYQKAKRRYFGSFDKYYRRHGYKYGERANKGL